MPRSSFRTQVRRRLRFCWARTKDPKVEVQPLRFVPDAKYPAFRSLVINQGTTHLALDARLLIASQSGQRQVLTGGFGKWLLPGQSTNLEFRLDRELTPGNYQLVLEVQNGQESIVKKADDLRDRL